MRIAADTIVLVRYLVWDDPTQADAATRAIEEADSLVISSIVLCELVWVLRRAYRRSAGDIAAVLRRLVESDTVQLDRPLAEAGLAALEAGGDFADGVILAEARRARCDHLISFDRTFPRSVAGIEVEVPR
jgi:predicted nucleic-acid-binding protein